MQIYRTVLQTDFKYMAIMWQNNEELMDYYEKEAFDTFENTELMHPESGNKFNVLVGPDERKLVIFKQFEGSLMHGKPMIKMKTNYDAIFNKCLLEGKIMMKGQPNIYCR